MEHIESSWVESWLWENPELAEVLWPLLTAEPSSEDVVTLLGPVSAEATFAIRTLIADYLEQHDLPPDMFYEVE